MQNTLTTQCVIIKLSSDIRNNHDNLTFHCSFFHFQCVIRIVQNILLAFLL